MAVGPNKAKTKFFKTIVRDRNVADAQVLIFFERAYKENEGESGEQLRLLGLLAQHRPELESRVGRSFICGT